MPRWERESPYRTAYLWLLYLLLATWPISVYVGSRLLGWGDWTAAGAAATASLLVFSAPGFVSYGFEWGSYIWSGTGLYGQLWAMWLLPLAWGLTWRTVKDGRRYAAAAIAVALTIACHFIAGYLALLTIGVWVIALIGAGRVLPRLVRAAVVAGGAMLIALWVLVPLIEGTTWTNNSEYFRGTTFDDSYGTGKVLGWLVRGQLFDQHRFPVISLLFAAGLVVCVARARRDARARGLLGVFAPQPDPLLRTARARAGARVAAGLGRRPVPTVRDGRRPRGDPHRRSRCWRRSKRAASPLGSTNPPQIRHLCGRGDDRARRPDPRAGLE